MALTKDTLAEIGQLALKIRHHQDPEVKRQFAALVKKVNPSINFPDIEADERLSSAISKINEDREKEKNEAAQKEITTKLASQRDALKGRYTDDQIKQIEELMLSRGLDNYEDAAILYAHYNPPERLDLSHRPSTSLELPSNKDWLTNPKKMALNTAYDVIDELRGRANRAAAR